MYKHISVITLALVLVLGAGCATMDKGPDDQAVVTQLVQDWVAAFATGDVNQLMPFYSKDFQSEEGPGTYDQIEQMFGQILPRLKEVGVVPDISATQVAVEGNTATAQPIMLSPPNRDIVIKHTFSKEDGNWIITGSSMRPQ